MSDITEFKLSIESLQAAYDRAKIINSTAQSLSEAATSFKNSARTASANWTNDTIVEKHTSVVHESNYVVKDASGHKEYDEFGNPVIDQQAFSAAKEQAKMAAKSWILDRRIKFLSYADSFCDYIDFVKGKTQSIEDALNLLIQGVENFESITITDDDLNEAAKKNIAEQQKLLRDYRRSGATEEEIAEYKKSLRCLGNVSFEETEAGDVQALDLSHEDSTVQESVNAAYSYTTTTTSTAVVVAALGNQRGWSNQDIEQYQMQQVSYNAQVTERQRQDGYFDTRGDTKAKAKEIYETTFNEPYTPQNVQNKLEELKSSSGISEEEMNFIGNYMGAGVNPGSMGSFTSVMVSVDKVLTPDYHPFETSTPATKPSFSPTAGCATSGCSSKGCGGCGNISGYVPTSITPSALVDKTSLTGFGDGATPMATPTAASITGLAEQSIPSPIKTDASRMIDQQASEIFYGKDSEQVAADRANALSIVDKAFSGEGVEEFKDVLKQGGFDDVDIDIIMDNKEIAVTAYILATESKSLTNIANQLATANGIANFDTIYDNGLSRMSLENGLSQSKLMAEVSDEVQDARTNLQNARNRYNNSVKKANDSIEDANKKKEEMEEIKKRIIKKSGDNPSKWDDDDIEAYNKAIEKYNEANRAANEAHQEAIQNKDLMDQAETDLTETQDKVANEYLKQHQEAQAASKAMAEGNDETLKLNEKITDSEVEQVSNDRNSLSTNDLVTDNEGNVEVQKTEDTFVSPGEESKLEVSKISSSGSSNDNVEVERKLTTDDLMDLFDNIEDVANVSSESRTLDAVDLSSLSPDDRTLPNLGLGSSSSEVINTSSNDNMVSPTEVNNEIVDDRVIPGLEVNNTFDNITNVNEVKAIDIPGVEAPDSNSLVGFADKAAKDAQEKTEDFQNNKFNGMGGMSMNLSGLETETTYASNVSENKKDGSEAKADADAPTENKEARSVAGVQVQAEEDERHTDGVLIDSDDKVASEVSEDGRSLEYVEIE